MFYYLNIVPSFKAVQVFPKICEPDWSLDYRGHPVIKTLKGVHQEGDYILYLYSKELFKKQACTYY